MAPLLLYPRINSRSLGNTTATTPSISHSEGTLLQILALVFATLSVASSILAFYWFVKMRRSFRHDLIMLLIQSDMFKALWFMVYPIVAFAEPTMKNSKFCRANGFLVSVGIETSDFAILQIAVHTALYIFKPGSATGEGGLYPYRYIAYACSISFPLLMASLAFINDKSAYISEGTYCYLPVRPFWYRLALSWIPRYILFFIIVVIYVTIYYYVRYKLRRFDNLGLRQPVQSRVSLDFVRGIRKFPKRHSLPPTAPLPGHGPIPKSTQVPGNDTEQSMQPDVVMARFRNGKASVGSAASAGAHRFLWTGFMWKDNCHPMTSQSENKNPGINTTYSPPQYSPLTLAHQSLSAPPSPRFNFSTPSSFIAPRSLGESSTRDDFFHRYPQGVERSSSIPRKPSGGNDASTLGSQLQLLNSRGQNIIDLEMLHTRDKIRRQLRFLFIYPLVYMLMWIIPFVAHVLEYDDRLAVDHPFALTCANTIFICAQAAVDCWLFSTREKPWRHIPGTDGRFWGSLKFWSGWNGVRKGTRPHHGPGKTRDEMVREARQAYQRRDGELADRRVTGVLRSENVARNGDKDWWDAAKLAGPSDFGGMSPVTEEISTPMNALGILEGGSLTPKNGHEQGESTIKT